MVRTGREDLNEADSETLTRQVIGVEIDYPNAVINAIWELPIDETDYYTIHEILNEYE